MYNVTRLLQSHFYTVTLNLHTRSLKHYNVTLGGWQDVKSRTRLQVWRYCQSVRGKSVTPGYLATSRGNAPAPGLVTATWLPPPVCCQSVPRQPLPHCHGILNTWPHRHCRPLSSSSSNIIRQLTISVFKISQETQIIAMTLDGCCAMWVTKNQIWEMFLNKTFGLVLVLVFVMGVSATCRKSIQGQWQQL